MSDNHVHIYFHPDAAAKAAVHDSMVYDDGPVAGLSLLIDGSTSLVVFLSTATARSIVDVILAHLDVAPNPEAIAAAFASADRHGAKHP